MKKSAALDTQSFSILNLKTKASLLTKSLDSKDYSKVSILLPTKYKFDEDPSNLKLAKDNIQRQAEFIKKHVQEKRDKAIKKIEDDFKKKVGIQKQTIEHK